MSTYQCDKVIEGVDCCFTNSLYQIDKDRVIVGGINSFSIVNIDKCVIEKRIKDKSLGYVDCFLKFRDNKTILCGCDDGIFCFYDMNTKRYKITKNNHNDAITDLLLIDDNTFLSCSTDTTIKVWRNKEYFLATKNILSTQRRISNTKYHTLSINNKQS